MWFGSVSIFFHNLRRSRDRLRNVHSTLSQAERHSIILSISLYKYFSHAWSSQLVCSLYALFCVELMAIKTGQWANDGWNYEQNCSYYTSQMSEDMDASATSKAKAVHSNPMWAFCWRTRRVTHVGTLSIDMRKLKDFGRRGTMHFELHVIARKTSLPAVLGMMRSEEMVIRKTFWAEILRMHM